MMRVCTETTKQHRENKRRSVALRLSTLSESFSDDGAFLEQIKILQQPVSTSFSESELSLSLGINSRASFILLGSIHKILKSICIEQDTHIRIRTLNNKNLYFAQDFSG